MTADARLMENGARVLDLAALRQGIDMRSATSQSRGIQPEVQLVHRFLTSTF